ncbi:unnamed protein product [Caenorhabditis auriculariae]|uniref:Uncharacterized protein n=1 Tax=Caenorhabditis auriculariae TaxID=2777116 RepID=A0A8S1HUR6_9PELO|nr:unnamed protein product [Caenorhabditis auriculariae]
MRIIAQSGVAAARNNVLLMTAADASHRNDEGLSRKSNFKAVYDELLGPRPVCQAIALTSGLFPSLASSKPARVYLGNKNLGRPRLLSLKFELEHRENLSADFAKATAKMLKNHPGRVWLALPRSSSLLQGLYNTTEVENWEGSPWLGGQAKPKSQTIEMSH